MPNITRHDFGKLGPYTLDELRTTPTLPLPKYYGLPRRTLLRIQRWVGDAVGLGGIHERYTTGELVWWMVSAWLRGGGTGGIISWVVAN